MAIQSLSSWTNGQRNDWKIRMMVKKLEGMVEEVVWGNIIWFGVGGWHAGGTSGSPIQRGLLCVRLIIPTCRPQTNLSYQQRSSSDVRELHVHRQPSFSSHTFLEGQLRAPGALSKISITPPSIDSPHLQQRRFCPLCLGNPSWLRVAHGNPLS